MAAMNRNIIRAANIDPAVKGVLEPIVDKIDTFDALLPNLSAGELAVLDTALAGTVVASKAVVYDAAGKVYRSSASPAAAGTTVADATPMTAEFNTVTGADGTKGVLLPIAAANEIVTVVNTNAANALKVYAITGSQINALGSTVAFTVTAGQTATFVGRSATLWYTAAATDTITGLTATAAELNKNAGVTGGTVTASKTVVVGAAKDVDTLKVALTSVGAGGIEDAITAHVGGTQAAAFALSVSKSVHNVTVVGSAADSVKLPAATGSGDIHWVKNSAAANSLQLYGSGTDTIDAVATATGVAVAAGKSRICVDTAAGLWQSILGA